MIQRLNQWKNEIEKRIVVTKNPINPIYTAESGYKQGKNFPDKAALRVFDAGKDWWNGEADAHAWFYFSLKTPCAKEHIRYEVSVEVDKPRLNPQFLVYLNGNLAEGLDFEHRSVPLQANTDYEIWVYAYGGAELTDRFFFNAFLTEIDERVENFYYDLLVPVEALALTEENSREYHRVCERLEKAVAMIEPCGTREEFLRSVEEATAYLQTEYYEKLCGKTETGVVSCVGHTHIDAAWLWSLEQTREKAQHSFSNTVALLDEFPEYRFMSSQPQLYEFAKEEDPELYARMKEKITAGVWEPEGATWVEPDCNLPSGESMIRQILFGSRFFKEEFGKDCMLLWLPDSFGFSPSLPQIFKKCGLKKFVTSKISWNEKHALPDDLFIWRGNDGSEILAYCLTAQDKTKTGTFEKRTRYSGLITPTQVYGCYDRFRNKDLYDGALMPFGFGDGGGGANRRFLRTLRRLSKGVPTLPVAENTTLKAFFEKLDKSVAGKKLPVWNGELYLELHRGVHTTMAKIKKYNREAEFALRNAEMLSALAEIYFGREYPKAELDGLWKTLLLNQFHDILSGTCIKPVCERACAELKGVVDGAKSIAEKALALWRTETGAEDTLFVWNPTAAAAGSVLVDGEYRYLENLPANGYAVVKAQTAERVEAEKTKIENGLLRVDLDEQGNIVQVFDKRVGRALTKAGRFMNELAAYEDNSHEYDAWDIKEYAYKRRYPIEFVGVEVFREGCRAGVKVTRKLHGSTIVQKICLYPSEARVDFDTQVDWRETHVLLKALFPLDITCEKWLTETQYGYAERPLFLSTEWDKTHFEVFAHKYAALSEGKYSVGILNDGKYGYGVRDGEISLSLLRSPVYPYPESDRGEHRFTYSLYACDRGFADSDIPLQARRLNDPPVAYTCGGAADKGKAFLSCDRDEVVIDTLKKCESGDGYALRVYESKGSRCRAEIALGFRVDEAVVCDMLEREEGAAALTDGNRIALTLKPFEAVTIKLKIKK